VIQLSSHVNISLFYNWYPNIWSAGHLRLDDQKDQRLLERLGRQFEGPPGSPAREFLEQVRSRLLGQSKVLERLLDSFHARRRSLVEQMGGEYLCFRTETPFVSGLGGSHVLETGFVLDRNLGVPYLPSSGLKGAIRAWAKWFGQDEGTIRRVLGPEQGADQQSMGGIQLLDLYPEKVPQLRLDVLTPHFGEYSEGKEESPLDWLEPVPIPYLTVSPGQVFCTGIIRTEVGTSKDVQLGKRWLAEALGSLGVGTKTAMGYGRLT